MCVCGCVNVCVCGVVGVGGVYACMQACVRVHAHACMCVCVCACLYVFVCVWVCIHLCVFMWIWCMRACIRACVCVCLSIHCTWNRVWILSKKQNKQKRTKPLKKKFLTNQTHETLHIKMSNNHTTLSPIKWSTLFLMKIYTHFSTFKHVMLQVIFFFFKGAQ